MLVVVKSLETYFCLQFVFYFARNTQWISKISIFILRKPSIFDFFKRIAYSNSSLVQKFYPYLKGWLVFVIKRFHHWSNIYPRRLSMGYLTFSIGIEMEHWRELGYWSTRILRYCKVLWKNVKLSFLFRTGHERIKQM